MFLIIVLTGAATLLSSCGAGEAEPADLPPVVRLAVAQPAGLDGDAYTGVVSARLESAYGFRIPGEITARYVDVGDTVRRGQVLARIDARDYRLGATQAGAQAQAAQARATAAQRQVAAAQAAATRASADERRLRALVDEGAVSRRDYDAALAASRAAAADLAAARAGASAERSGSGAASAQAAQARNQAGYTALVADADGVVTAVLAEPGQVVSIGDPVIRIAQAGPREAVIAVPEQRRDTLPRSASASLYGRDGQVFPTTLRQVAAAADPLTRTFEARYVLGGAGAQAPIGATVTVRSGSGSGGLAVPTSALLERGNGPAVWLFDPRTQAVRLQPVQVQRLGEEDALVSGIPPGSRVVALGVHLLRPGQRVRPQGGTGQ